MSDSITPLRPLATEIWEVVLLRSRPGWRFPYRSVVVRLGHGGLWLHSPIPISDGLADELAALGEVEHIVAPSAFHHLWAQAARTRYPAATLWAAPGLPEKRPDIRFDAVLGTDRAPWAGEIDPLVIAGMPKVNETVFLHRRSKTLICTDLLFHLPGPIGAFGRLALGLLGVGREPAQGRMWRFSTRDRRAAAASMRRLLEWDFERLVMAHGEVIDVGARDALRRVSSWLPRRTD